jgi:hypothetical protein
MKNFLHKKDDTPAYPIFRKYFNVFRTPQLYSNLPQKLQLHSFVVLLSFMRFLFFVCHRQILYQTKIKSPE